MLVKLVESPFYATGGGQVADVGYVECADGDCRARVEDVLRIGEDQVLALVPERGPIEPGERVRAHVDRAARHATECNHTATHLLHAALRRRLGTHVRQAGSYVGPDKLRFDFTHGKGLSEEELRDVEDTVNGWILEDQPVHALTTTLEEARRLGAMALFGEKYGDVVRMVEVGDGSFSRELCGGTHVQRTAEIGLFRILRETSSAANVRRIEAVTGPAAVELMRRHDAALGARPQELRVTPEAVPEAVHELRAPRAGARALGRSDPGGAPGSTSTSWPPRRSSSTAPRCWSSAVEVERRQGAARGRRPAQGQARRRRHRARHAPARTASTWWPASRRRWWRAALRAGDIVKAAAAVVGGGGGGRDTLARAGGRDAERLPEAIEAARQAIRGGAGRKSLRSVRVLALDYGSARCGCAVSDPTGLLATPIEPVVAPALPPRTGPAACAGA